MAYVKHPRFRPWIAEWIRYLMLVVPAIPALISALHLCGISLSEGVWALQALTGIGLLLLAGYGSLDISAKVPAYRWYAVTFFLSSFGLWFLWQDDATETLAHAISAALSVSATLIMWQVLRDY